MTAKHEVYKCFVCGNLVEVVHRGDGVLWCCGRPMTGFSEKNVNADEEPFFPVVEHTPEGIKVTIRGDQDHVMDDDHQIQWIELIADGHAMKKFLKPGDVPEAIFKIDAEKVRARAYCTQHGLYVQRSS